MTTAATSEDAGFARAGPAGKVDLFVYGSLMFAPVWERVARQVVDPIPARLDGFRRQVVRGASYPGIVAAAGHSVDGRLCCAVGPEAIVRLDRFEGDEYERVPVVVATGPHGAHRAAWAYRYRDVSRLADEPWDEAAFARDGLARFLIEAFAGDDDPRRMR